jgi:hypothetical protein
MISTSASTRMIAQGKCANDAYQEISLMQSADHTHDHKSSGKPANRAQLAQPHARFCAGSPQGAAEHARKRYVADVAVLRAKAAFRD